MHARYKCWGKHDVSQSHATNGAKSNQALHGFESKAIPTHGVIENIEVRLKEFPEKIVYIDIIVVDVPNVWGMLLSRKFGAMIGGSLEMDLTFLRLPLKDGMTGPLLNVPIIGSHV